MMGRAQALLALAFLALCVAVPWSTCVILRRRFTRDLPVQPEARDRVLSRYRRATFAAASLCLIVAYAGGALVAGPTLPWTGDGTVSAWLYSSLCFATTLVTFALAQRTSEDAPFMPVWEVVRRSVALSTTLVAPAATVLALPWLLDRLALPPAGTSVLVALLSVGAVAFIGPWAGFATGAFRRLAERVEVEGASWRLAHLAAPTPFLNHAAAIPWLRTVLVSDEILRKLAPDERRELLRYEASRSPQPRVERLFVWAAAASFSTLAFAAARVVGRADPHRWVAASVFAVTLTACALWRANRQWVARVSSQLPAAVSEGSLLVLARALRQMPFEHGQFFPRTSRQPLGPALYDKLYTLGYDPGPRPESRLAQARRFSWIFHAWALLLAVVVYLALWWTGPS